MYKGCVGDMGELGITESLSVKRQVSAIHLFSFLILRMCLLYLWLNISTKWSRLNEKQNFFFLCKGINVCLWSSWNDPPSWRHLESSTSQTPTRHGTLLEPNNNIKITKPFDITRESYFNHLYNSQMTFFVLFNKSQQTCDGCTTTATPITNIWRK